MRNLYKVLTVTLTFMIFFSYFKLVNTYADTFNDVKKEDYFYSSIDKISSLGIIVGDLKGNFNPNLYMSKFEVLRFFSKIIGYRDQDNYSENNNIKDNKYKKIIEDYSKKYDKWDNSYNNDMEFLLEHGILKEEDLNEFIILDKEGSEQVRALSREDLSLFLFRIINKNNEIEHITEYNFKDEHLLKENKKNSVYYMNKLGIITEDVDGNFYPKKALTKAELCVILDKFLEHTKIEIKKEKRLDRYSNHFHSRFVTIEKIFYDINTIQIKTGDETIIYQMKPDSTIKIDGILGQLIDIKEGSSAEIIIENSFVSQINVYTMIEIKDNTKNEGRKIYGTIRTINEESISVSYRFIDELNLISREIIEIIPFSKDYKVTNGGVSTSRKDIDTGNLATIILYNNMASEIILEEKNAIVMGSILGKGENVITIQTVDNKIFDIKVTENTNIIKNGKNSNSKYLRIGDRVTINTNKNIAIKIDVKSNKLKKDGIVSSIKIEENYSTITLQDLKDSNIKDTYYVDTNIVDIHSIYNLDKVSLFLDSKEVYAINVLERNYNKNFSGEVIDFNSQYLTVFMQDITGKSTTKVYIDESTTFFDYEKLEEISLGNMKKGCKVYVAYDHPTSKIASNVSLVLK